MALVSDRAWVDGQVVARESAAPSVASSTLHMGTGVFDGIMAYWNRDHWQLHLGRQHFERFVRGCEHMRLRVRWSPDELEAGAHQLLATCAPTTQYLRPIAYRGAPEILLVPSRQLPVTTCLFAVSAERNLDVSLTCAISLVRRISSRAIPVAWKVCGAYANSFLAQSEAIERGYDTALMLDGCGNLSEAAASNLFLVGEGRLMTPAIGADVFPGLTRRLIIEIARQESLAVSERAITPAELESCDAAFLCSTLLELRPLARIGERALASGTHPVVRMLTARFRGLTSV